MAVEIGAGYIANALLQNLVIPEIAKRLAGKAGEKGAKLKDIDKPEWLRKIGLWLDNHPIGTPEKVEKIINEHQEEILRKLTEHKGELSDLGQQIFDVVNELKGRIDDAQLTDEDKEFLVEVKKNFDPDEFEKRLEKILQKNAGVDQQKLREELMIFFDNMGWGDKLDVIDSKLDLVLKNTGGIEDIKGRIDLCKKSERTKIRYLPREAPPDLPEFVDRETHLDDLRNTLAKKIVSLTKKGEMEAGEILNMYHELIDKALKELPIGKILFNPPEKMKVGDTELVEVRITQNITEDLTKGLEGRGKAKIKETEVSSYMKVRLTGSAFKIVPEISEPQIIESDKYTEWQFHVTPLKSGRQTLRLTYYVIISIAGYDDKQKAYKVGDWKVNVKVNPMYFLKCYWQFIVGTLIAIVTLIIAIIAIM